MPKQNYKPFSALSARQRRRRLNTSAKNSAENKDPIDGNRQIEEPDSHLLASVPVVEFHENVSVSLVAPLIEPVAYEENIENFIDDTITESNIEIIEPESDTDESDTEQTETFNINTFSVSLSEWANNGSVPLARVNELLKLLKTHHCFSSLPSDARTLLKTPRTTKIKKIGSGEYCHLGIKKSIIHILDSYSAIGFAKDLKLQCNIDGLPISRSSNSNIWPILMAFSDYPQISPMTVGIFHGDGKPESCSSYLSDYVTELVELVTYGLVHLDNKYNVIVDCYVCDAPARSYVAQIKGHTGYWCCSKCEIKGRWAAGRVTFDEFEAVARTHENFINKTDENHHLKDSLSPLLQIPGINMVNHFPFEYMHLVCLGVMRKILFSFLKGDSYNVRLSTNLSSQISNKLISIRPYIPSEFVRKPRSLTEILRWKATEFRQILLYTSPLVFAKIVKPEVYKHFLSFHFAIRILVSQNYSSSMLQYASVLLKYFVSNFGSLYGDHNISYNVHGLLHLADDVEKFGPLDKFSAFKFENKLQELKKLLRKHDKPLQQLVRRIYERNLCDGCSFEEINAPQTGILLHKSKIHHGFTIYPIGLTAPSYNYITINGFKVSIKRPDNCVILETKDVCVVDFIATNENGELFFYGRKFRVLDNFYTKPEPSGRLGIYLAKSMSQASLYAVKDIKSKAMMIPLTVDEGDESRYVVELIHH
uniref:Transposase domain-containing protein n=1 Tax=Photinus pyralis TaxID=7054 RepID=A0A1Y1KZS3_PHOPY